MRALSRVVAILEVVAGCETGLTMTQVATRVGLSAPTASRLLRDMAAEELLDRQAADGSYLIGPRMKAIGLLTNERGLPNRARPVMEQLRDLSGETCSLHVRSGNRRICLAEVQSAHSIRRVIPVGTSLPLHGGGTGEVLLLGLSPSELGAYLAQVDVRAADNGALLKRLETIRRQGWGVAVDALESGVAGLSAPIYDSGVVVASLSLSGPSARWTRKRMTEFAQSITTAARSLSLGA